MLSLISVTAFPARRASSAWRALSPSCVSMCTTELQAFPIARMIGCRRFSAKESSSQDHRLPLSTSTNDFQKPAERGAPASRMQLSISVIPASNSLRYPSVISDATSALSPDESDLSCLSSRISTETRRFSSSVRFLRESQRDSKRSLSGNRSIAFKTASTLAGVLDRYSRSTSRKTCGERFIRADDPSSTLRYIWWQ